MILDNPIRMVRELGPAGWAVFSILQFSLKQGRVTQKYIETWTGLSDKTVSKSLAYLEEIGVANHSRSGWMLLEEAQQLPLMDEEAGPGEEVGPVTDRPDPGEKENATRKFSDSLLTSSSSLLINNNLITTTNLTSSEDGNFPTDEAVQRILDAAEELFGQKILGDVADYANIDRLLAWIAKANDGYRRSSRSKVFNPAGLVYWAFHKGINVSAEKRYSDWDQIEKYLPESFQRASGQWEFEDG